MTKRTLPPFHETRYGYLSQVGDHSYQITFNGIDYDVIHYWAYRPDGELIGRTASPSSLARDHYAKLMSED